MSSFAISGQLTRAVDACADWLIAWHRAAFIDTGNRTEQVNSLALPSGFMEQEGRDALTPLPQEQPALDRLKALYEQLHTLARLVLMKTPNGHPVARADYDNVIAKYQELIHSLRRFERAFVTAASGLDPLTGLRSRTGLTEELAREHTRSLRAGRPFCVAIMDVDHFKSINDTYGHDAGDRVLAAVADHVSHGLRSFDDAYRLGGEEFLMCLKDTDRAAGFAVVERLRAGLEKKSITLSDGKTIFVTASFGLAACTGDSTPDTMLKQADNALYRAKKEGRNKTVMAE